MTTPNLPAIEGVGPSRVSVPAGSWTTVLDFLADRFAHIERSEWLARLQAGLVLDAAGQALHADATFVPHTTLYYYRHLADEPRIPFEEQIVYQDEHIVVADKPHFLPVTPSGRYAHETLLARLKRRLGIDALVPVHRIDRETAGLVMFSIQPETRGIFQAMFREHRIDKCYEAIAPSPVDIAFPLVRKTRLVEASHFMQMCETEGVPNAETRIERIATQRAWSRYRLWPRTGKRHQLRVHMAALGLPIVGDAIYPTLQPERALPCFDDPLRLLALELSFKHPISGDQCSVKSERELDWPASN